jgi:hypothetical protein
MFDLLKGLEDLTVPEVGIIDPSPHLEFREEKVLRQRCDWRSSIEVASRSD